MSNLTKVPLDMLSAAGKPGSNVEFDGKEIKIGGVISTENPDIGNANVTGAHYDQATGSLIITFSNGYELKASGFMTSGNIGVGPAGPQGLQGQAGVDGLQGRDGQKGSTGEQGTSGPQGRIGATGPEGPRGDPGIPGAAGATGPQGEKGKVEVYVTAEDPGAEAGPGALWVVPG